MGQLTFSHFLAMKRHRDAIRHRNVFVDASEEDGRYQPGTLQAFSRSCVVAACYPLESIGQAISTAQTDLFVSCWNIQQQADAGNAQSITEGVNGLVITTSADDNEGTQIRTARNFTPSTGMKFHAHVRFQAASLETRILFGFAVKNADPIANLSTVATITDQITWHMDADPGDGVLTTSCTGNASTLRNGTDLSAITVDQDIELGITGVFGASGSLEWWYNLNPGTNDPVLTKVSPTANQLTQFQGIMTTPPTTMCGVFQALNTAGTSRAVTIKDLAFYVERD